MKKKLDTDTLASELRDASPFFRGPRAPSPVPRPPGRTEPVQPRRDEPLRAAWEGETRPTHSESTPRPERTPRTGPPAKRVMKRHSFEIYYDQYDGLVELAAADRMRGGVGSMSQIVRDALDKAIDRLRRTGET